MNSAPGADERQIREALDARGVGYAPQPPTDARERDWLDDLWDEELAVDVPKRAPVVPPPAEPPDTAVAEDGEPRWDWRRLRHWPNARPALAASCALVAALIPIPHVGYSAATTWAYCTHQIRDQHGMGWAYAVGSGAFALATWLIARRGRHAGLIRLAFLAITLVGLFGFIHPSDIITFLTGAP